jgi:hypothetical protein
VREKLFDPEKELIELRVFWVIVLFGLIITFFCYVFIQYFSNLTFDLSYQGFNFFVVAFKVPIGIITVTISLIGLTALAHRSAQTKQQIHIANNQYWSAQNQNMFANYYKHREEFFTHIKEIIGRDLREEQCTSIHNERKSKIPAPYLWSLTLHRKLYPSAQNGDMTINQLIIEKVIEFVDLVIQSLEAIVEEPSSTECAEVVVVNYIDAICETFAIPNSLKSKLSFSTKHQRYEYAVCVKNITRTVFDIIAFDKLGDMQIDDSSLRERFFRNAQNCIIKYHAEVTGDNLIR